jgi:hypothetical protein
LIFRPPAQGLPRSRRAFLTAPSCVAGSGRGP